ncbi:hypothetical protein GPALN_006256 [Globodera pallida]|nr:hypothetical protein GPALN_006256 [Globodera pallida]
MKMQCLEQLFSAKFVQQQQQNTSQDVQPTTMCPVRQRDEETLTHFDRPMRFDRWEEEETEEDKVRMVGVQISLRRIALIACNAFDPSAAVLQPAPAASEGWATEIILIQNGIPLFPDAQNVL